jgi:diguanylate cyclase (GGDEF)-like protein
MKLKIFSPSGEILYSTNPDELGDINGYSYFHEHVARGKTYTKVVKKDTESLEGQKVAVDVVETYVPIMKGNKFYGAFEIYYDLSSRNRELNDFIVISSIVTLILMFGYLVTLIYVILRSDKRNSEILLEHLPRRLSSPFYSILLITISLFVTETIVMLVISALPSLSVITRAVFDSTLLVVLVSPMLYFFMLRPLLVHITELAHAKQRISHMSLYDDLTNLPNRTLFGDRLQQAVLHAERYKRKLAVLFLDLDNFKRLNDIFEHRGGDLILREIADRLSSNLRSSDAMARMNKEEVSSMVARLGGDEFSILLTEVQTIQDVIQAAGRVKNILSKPMMINDQEVFITSSIGIATYPGDGQDADSLLRNAHSATYYLKNHGRNNFQFYEDSMNETAFHRLILENDLHKALDNEEFILYYQPRMDILTGNIASLEALIRMIKPDRGIIPPMEFIPLAEESGLIVPIGEWVMRNACQMRKSWQYSGLIDTSISVNISGYQFQRQDFISTIARILEETGLDPSLLELEITETVMMQGGRESLTILHQLKDMGVCLAMDDFGTGYSSFSYLKSFPLDTIKIDRSFIRDVTTNKDTAAIVEAIVAMALRLDLRIVAEGVETGEQLAFLKDQGCHEIQGFFITPPLPADAIYPFIMETSNRAHIIS